MAIKSPTQVSQNSKLQILCLHGYLQNAEVTVASLTSSCVGLRDTLCRDTGLPADIQSQDWLVAQGTEEPC